MRRARVAPEARRDFFLYVDEWQSITTRAFATMLPEARKYGVALILANQYLAQLDDEVRAAVLGNVGTMIFFRLGAEDAELIEKETMPEFSASDLVNLPRYHIALRLMMNGQPTRPFSAETLPPPAPRGDEADIEILRRIGRERYATDRGKCEEILAGAISI